MKKLVLFLIPVFFMVNVLCLEGILAAITAASTISNLLAIISIVVVAWLDYEIVVRMYQILINSNKKSNEDSK